MKLPNLRKQPLRARFALGLSAVLLPFLLAAAVGFFYLLPQLTEPLDNILRGLTEDMEPLMALQSNLLRAAMPPNDYLIHGDPAERVKFAQARRQVERTFAAAAPERYTQAEVRALIESARKEWEQALRTGEAILRLRDPLENHKRARDMEKSFDAHIYRAVDLLEQADVFFHRMIDENHATVHTARTRSIQITSGAVVLALAVSAFAGAALARSILVPMQKLEGAVVRLGAGDLAYRVEALGDDELGRLAETFNAMAQTLEQNRAQLERRAERLAALNWVAVALTSSFLSLKELLDQIMRSGADLTGAKAACIAFYDEATGLSTEWVTHSLSEHFVQNMSFRPGGLADEAFTTANHILSNDRPGTKYKLSKLAREEGLKSFVCLPLTSHDRRLGVIYFYRTDRDEFTPSEIELLATFAALAAQAIENARRHGEATQQARTDALTGLDNRHEFQRRLEEEFERSRRYGHPVALLMLDLDHFKNVNDTYGHPAGDEVLRALAARLRAQVRPTDHVARYGGEEFAAILPETPADDAREVAERVRRAAADAPIRLPDGREIGLTISIGVACCPDDAGNSEEIVEHADQALYVAKQAGRNRALLYRKTLKAGIEKDPARIVALLNEGIENIGPLVTAVSSKAAFFHGHTEAVERVAARLAAALALPETDAAALALAARLHDIGMAAIPDSVLNKTSTLESGERDALRRHPAIAAGWLAQVPALAHLAPIVRHHHERWDGGGYPDELKGEATPFLARVLAVADAYGAMIADYPGRKAMAPKEVEAALRAGAGTQFDPAIVRALLEAPS